MKVTRKVLNLALLVIIVVASVGIGIAVVQNYFMFHQNLTVPSNSSMAVYDKNDNLISSGSDLASYWSWTGTQFTLELKIKNTGNTVLTTGLNTTDVPGTWSVSILGNGTLTQGTTQPVTVIAIPPNNNSGTTSGDFDLWLTG